VGNWIVGRSDARVMKLLRVWRGRRCH